MTDSVLIESECLVDNLDFPRHLDHAWLFLAAGIHARMFRRMPDDTLNAGLIQEIQMTPERGEYVLSLSDDHTWTDNIRILPSEIAQAINRGTQAGIFSTVRRTTRGIEVKMSNGMILTPELLASPLFFLTPSCRIGATLSPATSGPYALTSCSPDRRIMKFRRRSSTATTEGPGEVSIIVTENRFQGMRLLEAGRLTLSCPLGANPAAFARSRITNTVANRTTNIGMILRPYTGCTLADDIESLRAISQVLRRHKLAKTTSGTFLPMFDMSELFSPQHCRDGESLDASIKFTKSHRYTNAGSLELRYASFEPNKRIAREISRQLWKFLGVKCNLIAASYSDYVASRFPHKCGLSIEILQPFVPETLSRRHWEFINTTPAVHDKQVAPTEDTTGSAQPRIAAIPLLKCMTSMISFDERYRGRQILTNEALLDWCNL